MYDLLKLPNDQECLAGILTLADLNYMDSEKMY